MLRNHEIIHPFFLSIYFYIYLHDNIGSIFYFKYPYHILFEFTL